ncbi:2Fe-2S iron-sulfur cluster-binding protein [Gloeobacter kilaueensis]|uniref:Ferredoxin n=1 Tax=Gloeobacter kilaueensis (strain ATCC BAA-2537 / CCAP 1431/1 / ULC 316 / JS1) TaxID=1183438 RepID=U5QIG9_GLOK1|nr:2Fe-2S iron-sulfur cluster-binding protein [Gloeobacter kilaueensis]AGY58782.1 ferredoxin [Gloeobacter kilaueensis JS1]
MPTYPIELVNREGYRIAVEADQFILAAVEAAGVRLPVGCRYGACITCAARLIEGEVDQPGAVGLRPEHIAQGYVLLCVAQARSHCRFEVGLESQAALYTNPFQ